MEKQLGLKSDQYELDPVFNPKDLNIVQISRTSGALTKYTYALRVVKKIRIELKLKHWMEDGKFPKDWFRWFTWQEIKREKARKASLLYSALH